MVLHAASTVISTAPRKGGAEPGFTPLGPDLVWNLPGPMQLGGIGGWVLEGLVCVVVVVQSLSRV